MKIRNQVRKWTLRKIAARFLNNDITQSPKRALQTPQREWLGSVLKPMVEKSLTKLSDHYWFNADELKKEWTSYLSGESDNSFFVWQWINTAELITE
jgi:asparagine synthase (glutamine-hydrolysing)